ncbi:MAG: hypothetical protein V1721_07885 [Pseudomonadota bacterium]
MTFTRRIWYATGFAGMLMMQSGCGSVSRASFCDIYQPVYMARQDTEETKKQLDRNNAVWLELCEKKIQEVL